MNTELLSTHSDWREARSTIDPASLQEMLDAETSAGQAMLMGQQQYATPEWLASACHKRLHGVGGIRIAASIVDPQCAAGALVNAADGYATCRVGFDIDNRIKSGETNLDYLLHGNCIRTAEILDELHPAIIFDAGHANPPFSKRWKLKDGTTIDSTEWTWAWLRKRCRCGYMIANSATIERLGLHKEPNVFHYETHENVWKECAVKIGVVFWRDMSMACSDKWAVANAMEEVAEVLEEEHQGIPAFNVSLGRNGMLRTHLSTLVKLKQRLTYEQIQRMHSIDNEHPLSLTVDRESRDVLRKLVDEGVYTIEPAAKAAIEDALTRCKAMAVPLMPVTNFEAVAYADEEEELKCIKDFETDGMQQFRAGLSYKLCTKAYQFADSFKCVKAHYSADTGAMYSAEHEMELSGTDRCIVMTDSRGIGQRFMDRPRKGVRGEHEEKLLWEHFEKPKVLTIADTHAAEIARNLKRMEDFEYFSDFKFYPGQAEYIARFACKDYGLVAGEVGVGKTLLALTLIQLKAPHRALIIAPQGTVRDNSGGDDEDEEGTEYNASQWISEIKRFAPGLAVFQLFSMDDYREILRVNKGKLPNGIYITYFQAFFRNDALELAPESWKDGQMRDAAAEVMGVDPTKVEIPEYPDIREDLKVNYWTKTVGMHKQGIRCIISPSMATEIGDQFDGVFVDEFHIVSNLNTIVTQGLIRLQPKYKFGFTATPISNIVSNLFAPMGWLCVPDWFKGNRRNPAWPYAYHEQGRFDAAFLCKQRDLTDEKEKRAADPRWRGKCERMSPIIASPARLLKILKPTMGFISKAQCHPGYKPGKLIDVRVEMGAQQSKLYAHFLNRGNIPCKNPLIAARKQIAYLRAICCDPLHFTHHTPHSPTVFSNMNPKTMMIMRLVSEILQQGEQVLIVSARKGQTNTLVELMTQAGVAYRRIDSTVAASDHARQANDFKEGKVPVLFLGIKCAMGYSFSDCPNEIIASIEYSPGPLAQARGRIERINSKRPPSIFCILHSHSIEETMFDIVATKDDSATICLRGQRVPRDYHPVESSELLAKSIASFTAVKTVDEDVLRGEWPSLRDVLQLIKWKAK